MSQNQSSFPSNVSHQPVSSPGPAKQKRAQHHRRGKFFRWALLGGALAFFLPVFLCGMAGVLYLLFPPAPIDILILGLDARSGEGYMSRSDSIMLVGIDPAGLDVSILSIPRDLFIQTPGYGWQRINTVNMLGEQEGEGNGSALVQAAIDESFDVEIDRYLRINFDAFTGVIDALGGIDIEVPYRLVDTQYPTADYGTTTYIFEPGWQHMDGQTALAYARTRHADDDYRRSDRQQQVVMALFRTLFKPENWGRIPTAMQTLFDAADTNLTFYDFMVIAVPALLDGSRGEIDRLVIDRDLLQRTPDGYTVPNYTALTPWLEAHFD